MPARFLPLNISAVGSVTREFTVDENKNLNSERVSTHSILQVKEENTCDLLDFLFPPCLA